MADSSSTGAGPWTHRRRIQAVMHYQDVDRLPVVHFGYWVKTLEKWADEGHLTKDQANTWVDGNPVDRAVADKLGFDFNWQTFFMPETGLDPQFETEVVERFPDGTKHVRNGNGVVVVQKPEAGSIPGEIDHLLKDRKSWEEHFRHRVQFTPERVNGAKVYVEGRMVRFDQGGADFLNRQDRTEPYGLHCGSLYGTIRNWLGLENACYLYMDDEALFGEIIDAVGEVCYECTRTALAGGATFDYAHFWEDICFKNGPLITPSVFEAKVGPHYKRITELVRSHGIDIISFDCDELIDSLIPTWLHNGVNTMFPIEVGTWDASIAPWREQYGPELLGVGGVRKVVFSRDRAAVDEEIERQRPLVDLGGYIPCPDHRLPVDAKWDNVRYYCDRMRETFG